MTVQLPVEPRRAERRRHRARAAAPEAALRRSLRRCRRHPPPARPADHLAAEPAARRGRLSRHRPRRSSTSSASAPSIACRSFRSASAPRSRATSTRPTAASRIDLGRMNRVLAVHAEDLDLRRRAGRHAQAAQRSPPRSGPVLPDRSRRRRDARRHGGDPRLGHQRRPLRHHARQRHQPHRRHGRRRRRQDRQPRARNPPPATT